MDLGLTGRAALVCASSRGLGRACATELARAGARVIINGRNEEQVLRTAREIAAETGAEVIPVIADLSIAAERAALLDRAGAVDILVNNNGGPPSADFRTLDQAALAAGVEANMLVPIALIQQVIDGMVARRFGRIVNITSFSVKMPIAGLDLSSGARAGLTGFVAGVARSVAHANVTINNVLPGWFDTQRIEQLIAATATQSGMPVEEVRAARIAAIPVKRFGDPDEFGKACAFLCSAGAGYITGQSLLMDGGLFPGII